MVYVLHEKSFLDSLVGADRVRRRRSWVGKTTRRAATGRQVRADVSEEGVGYATSPIGGQVSSADMSVVKVWVMSVTSNRVLIEERQVMGPA